jgi:hypothetical protein
MYSSLIYPSGYPRIAQPLFFDLFWRWVKLALAQRGL